ncbi:type IV toxin-antitoxin system AbiEi family antitoxin domain-containing protein [Motilibacter deserti]|uniref:Type IV toxin-antitoxin system AbiEi family antitoxin domain-containing protein n=1 Tax=Motilibacter deserti TaxID=2714956 RepID=A0ABX0H0N3_9ACTN|nr:type IV toxin-antitoxin system AbiEi family antitoxin domain-containing protein [Motilibacter deserti]NHC15389.1 type IV toxin-antitoxin system AbiEi family antitoxin domain-containing protein [Motilibacter deserti]
MTPRLRGIAARQGNVFSTGDALRAGYTQQEVQRERRRGEWQSVSKGAYAERAVVESADEHALFGLRVAGALLTTRPGACASHASAAVLHGLPLLRLPEGVDLTTDTGAHLARRGYRLHVAPLPVEHRDTAAHGVSRTALARTVVDVARRLPLEEAVVVADAALASGKVSRAEVAAVLEWMQRWPGTAAARRTLDSADPRSESPGESLGRVRIVELGYAVDLQVRVSGLSGRVYRVDFVIDGIVIGEFDGKAKYTDPAMLRGRDPSAVLVAEKLRQEDLEDAGWPVVRFGWRDAHDPATLRRKIDAALARARRNRAT